MTDTIRNAIEGPRRAMGVILKKHLKTPDDICTLPREAMQWVLDHWDEAALELLSVVDRYTSGVGRSDEAAKATSIVLHLGGEKQDTRMFPLLCRLARDREALHTALGEDNVPTTFREILISTYDGDQGALKGLIEAAEVDEFVRGGALHVVAYLSATGRIARDETEAYLRRLYETMRPQQVSYVWFAWVLSIAQLGFGELSDVVRQVFARGLIMPRSMGYDDFCRALERTLSDPERMAGFRDDQLGPFEDAIGELSDWDWFSDAAKRNEERRANSPEMRI